MTPKWQQSEEAEAAKEVFEKGIKTKNVQQLHELQREYLGNKNKD